MKNLVMKTLAASVLLVSPVSMALDAGLPAFKAGASVSGQLSSVGSDSLANLMTFWSEDFKKIYPSTQVQVQAAGSSTAPPALTQGTADLAPMSRLMKPEEIQVFEKKFGYKPTAIPVAIDALAVFVHKDNPIKQMSMPMVDAIFSSGRKCGYPKAVVKWGDAGASGSLAKEQISTFGRNSVSGTYGYFKENALCKGDFKTDVKEQPGSASVVQAVAGSINAIGYSGMGYKVSGAKTVALKGGDGSFYEASQKNALSGKYPLSRYLYVYVNKKPGQALDPLTREFVAFVLSKQGQSVVERDGYIALPANVAGKVRKGLGIK